MYNLFLKFILVNKKIKYVHEGEVVTAVRLFRQEPFSKSELRKKRDLFVITCSLWWGWVKAPCHVDVKESLCFCLQSPPALPQEDLGGFHWRFLLHCGLWLHCEYTTCSFTTCSHGLHSFQVAKAGKRVFSLLERKGCLICSWLTATVLNSHC